LAIASYSAVVPYLLPCAFWVAAAVLFSILFEDRDLWHFAHLAWYSALPSSSPPPDELLLPPDELLLPPDELLLPPDELLLPPDELLLPPDELLLLPDELLLEEPELPLEDLPPEEPLDEPPPDEELPAEDPPSDLERTAPEPAESSGRPQPICRANRDPAITFNTFAQDIGGPFVETLSGASDRSSSAFLAKRRSLGRSG
jgi:hypothetical protein